MGKFTAFGTAQNFLPYFAYAWINLTQVTLNDGETVIVVDDNPTVKGADEKGSNKDVGGDGKLNLLHDSDVDHRSSSQNFVLTYINAV